jgi:hypothetical protein
MAFVWTLSISNRASICTCVPMSPVSQAMALPPRDQTGPRGAIVAGRIIPHTPFTEADLDMAEALAGQAAIALELSDARATSSGSASLRIGTASPASCMTT